nr:helix-turn-helix transcriptional regulator [uncultured Neokomagataea sp.]
MYQRKNSAVQPNKAQVLRQIGEIVRRERLAQEMTQAQLAHVTGFSETAIGRLEHGQAGISLDRFFDILWALDASEAVCLKMFQIDAQARAVRS